MRVRPLREDLRELLVAHKLDKKYDKRVSIIETHGIRYGGLHAKPTPPTKHLQDPAKHYVFWVDKKVRAVYFKPSKIEIEVFAFDLEHNLRR